jgi:ABC-2 type transport system ATP-binding protein
MVRFRLPEGISAPNAFEVRPSVDGLFECAPENLTATLHRLTGWALEQGVELDALEIIRPTLEDVYLQLTGAPDLAEGAHPSEHQHDRSESG